RPYRTTRKPSTASSRPARSWSPREFRSSYFDDKRATYGSMIVAHLRAKNSAEAFNYSERARSRAFLDILGSKVQLAKSGTLLEHERALQARISVLQAMMAGQDPDASEGSRLRQEVEGAQKAYADFLTQVRKENKEQASLINVEPLNLKQVQELLDPGVTMLEYFVVRGAVLLWVVEKDRVRFVNIPIARTELVAKVTSFRDTVYQLGEKKKFSDISQELYRLLIEPALPHVRGKEILVIPHDVLHYLPFQALLSGQDKYFIQDYPIYYLSSASLMQFTHEKRRAGGERALIMGNPSLGDEAYNLRFAEREAKEVAGAYAKSEVFLKAEASKPRAVSFGPKSDVLHFAVHAELNEDDPMSSALLLAPEGGGDGRLNVAEIFSLHLKADMVVLSACETGLGKLSNGDELVGLTRAFIYAGTPSIVTTLWKVNDRSSYELMREFYRQLKTGKKSEALRQAQLKTMKEFPEPFYWAAYQLTGEP
ncbi:MAG: CHAT domain-containing protein, partial [Candidatus Binatia bacterium]